MYSRWEEGRRYSGGGLTGRCGLRVILRFSCALVGEYEDEADACQQNDNRRSDRQQRG
ncbi:hypothetical protein SC1_02381 [Sphingopyxis sp. C-1]|nr:hypothetical protein SC1_02381 [Sphingopyxis sp. C-1]